jgi:hypothetical protein
MSKLSPEAQRAKYQYNKKYVDAYWERRAKRTETSEETKSGRSVRKTVERSSVEVRISFPEIDAPSCPSVRRENRTDEQYIKVLEKANKTLSGENRRLVRLLTKYQGIIEAGVRSELLNLKSETL